MIDARAGPMPADRTFAELVRKSGKPAVLIANKMEGTAGEAGRLEAYALGLGDPVAISAEHNEGLSDLYDALRAALPAQTAAAAEAAAEPSGPHPIRVAIVGRPNAGKSTLVNRLIGEERLLTAPEAGTTRDAIAVDLDWRGQTFRIHDTAGIRRRGRVDEKLEKLSVADALNAVRFAEVVVVLLDVGNAFEEQDQRIADLVEQEGRAIVIAVNKWDLKEKTAGAIGKLRVEADEKLMQMKGVPLVAVSAITGEGLDRLMQAIVDAYEIWNKRIPTRVRGHGSIEGLGGGGRLEGGRSSRRDESYPYVALEVFERTLAFALRRLRLPLHLLDLGLHRTKLLLLLLGELAGAGVGAAAVEDDDPSVLRNRQRARRQDEEGPDALQTITSRRFAATQDEMNARPTDLGHRAIEDLLRLLELRGGRAPRRPEEAGSRKGPGRKQRVWGEES